MSQSNHFCYNMECSYYKEHGHINDHETMNGLNSWLCYYCNHNMVATYSFYTTMTDAGYDLDYNYLKAEEIIFIKDWDTFAQYVRSL